MIRHFVHTRHIRRISLFSLALLYSSILSFPQYASSAVTPTTLPVTSNGQTQLPTIQLKFKPQKDISRFIFDFPEAVQYTISEQDNQTQIRFNRPYRLESTTLQKYPLNKSISFRKDADNSYVLIFPQKLTQN